MKKIFIIVLAIFALAAIMFAEYRFIMLNLRPIITEETSAGATVEIEFMGNVDVYYADKLQALLVPIRDKQ